jgi:hypothetical protein
MNLKLLSNEILLDIVDYFYGLNCRFNLLPCNSFDPFVFDFIICQKANSIWYDNNIYHTLLIKLLLFSLAMTMRLQIRFIFFVLTYDHLVNLFTCERWHINNLRSYKILLKVLNECQHLPNLIHLNFYSCSFLKSSADF